MGLMALSATRDNVILRRTPLGEVSVGGILIPEKAVAPPLEGTILSIGPQVADVKVGDRVLFPTHAGSLLKHGGETLMVFRELDLIAVIDR